MIMPLLASDELAASILVPCFDSVRDKFAAYEPVAGQSLDKLLRTRLLVDPAIADSERHYAACRDNGLEIIMSPDAADLPSENLVAIIAHEFGHAADFAYPGCWLFVSQDDPAVWVGRDGKGSSKSRNLWNARSLDQIEWTADSIVLAITGHSVGYCGRCLVQCFEGGKKRPKGLR